MRNLLYLIIVLLACSCRSPKKHHPTTTLVLKDSRGIIKMDLPPSWDTALQWTDHADCKVCGRIMYRFQRRAFPVYMDNSGSCMSLLDSVDQLTIIQEIEKQFTTDTLAAIKQFRANTRKALLMDNYHAHFVIDTIMQVGKHLIPVVGVFNDTNHMQTYDINAFAILKRDGVVFEFKLLATEKKKEHEHFVEKVMNVIRSIELEE